MAAEDPVVKILQVLPPRASSATPTQIAGTSSPAEGFRVWQFPDAAATYLDFLCMLKGYDGGGLTFRVAHGASVATGNVEWEIAIRAIPDDTEDLDTTAHTYDFNVVAAAVPSAIGEVAYDEITFTNGADMDSWAEETLAVVRIRRDAQAGNTEDTAAGIAYLHGFIGFETV